MSKVIEEKLEMRFDLSTIESLGVRLYSTLPPVLAELISNSWDALATEVKIYLNDKEMEKKIIIKDNGIGMSFNEINEYFLIIGKNKRSVPEQLSLFEKRKPIGKKGLGKLAMFGITDEITVGTTKENQRTEFTLSKVEIDVEANKGKDRYNPKFKKEKVVNTSNGTKITLGKIHRKNEFEIEELAISLAKYFNIYNPDGIDDQKFRVVLIHNNEKEIIIENNMRFSRIEKEFILEFPKNFPEEIAKYGIEKKICGEIILSKKALTKDNLGIMLLSRGKMVNKPSFYEARDTDIAHKYITGFLNINFIDEFEKDIISTARDSLTWSNELLDDLRLFLQGIVNYTAKYRREQIKEVREEAIKDKLGIDLKDWIISLDSENRPLAKRVTDTIINSSFDTDTVVDLVSKVEEMFISKEFRNYLQEITELEFEEEDKVLHFISKWKFVETNELGNIAKVRIEAIEKLEYYVRNNAREVPVIHNFLKEFPWLLDPRIFSFKDEVYYSDELWGEFPENDVKEESDRRIDFLCFSFSNTLYIIEIKRPECKVNLKYFEQLKDYVSYAEEKFTGSSETSIKRVVGYIISNERSHERKIDSEIKNGEILNKYYFRTYEDLLRSAKAYHQDLIDKKRVINEKGLSQNKKDSKK